MKDHTITYEGPYYLVWRIILELERGKYSGDVKGDKAAKGRFNATHHGPPYVPLHYAWCGLSGIISLYSDVCNHGVLSPNYMTQTQRLVRGSETTSRDRAERSQSSRTVIRDDPAPALALS